MQHATDNPPATGSNKWGTLDSSAAFGFITYAASATVTPICLVLLARELHFSLTAAGTLEVLRNILLVALLLISAFVAGQWGKVRSLAVGAFCIGGGMFLYAFADGYGSVAIALALLGVGGGLKEALINPLIQELHPTNSGRYLNIINGFWSIGVLLTMLISGELLTQGISWRFIVGGLGVMSVASGCLFLFFRRAQPRAPSHSVQQVMRHKLDILKLRAFWLFLGMMFIAGGIEGAYTFWIASYIQLELNALPRAGGIGTACFALGMIAGRFLSGVWVKQEHLFRLLISSAIAGLIVSLTVPLITSLSILYPVLFCLGLTLACFWPSIQSYAADRLPVDATVLFILLSCGAIPGFAFVSWIVGWLGDNHSLRAALWLMPALFVILIACFLRERKTREAAQLTV